MKNSKSILFAHKIVLLATVILFFTWIIVNIGQLTATQNGAIRFFLTMLFSFIILFRPKPVNDKQYAISLKTDDKQFAKSAENAVVTGILGSLLLIFGVVFDVHQVEWIGFLILCYSTLNWVLPASYRNDLLLALFILYWAHPLPGRIFGVLQLAMQSLSVQGSEWLLHLFNVHVMADKMVLITGNDICEVPAACSGMRTATTVFLLSAGLGIIKRLKWYQIIFFVMAALVQALVLNIIRISLIVVLTSVMENITSAGMLHNTMGVVPVIGIFLIYFEIDFFKKYQNKKDAEREQKAHIHDRIITSHPPFWKRLLTHRMAIFVTVSAVVLITASLYKNREFHRVEMIGKLTKDLIKNNRYEEAAKSIKVVLQYRPDSEEWQFTNISIMLAMQQYENVLDELNKMPKSVPVREIQKQVIRAYCMMGLNRLSEAEQIIRKLPPRTRETDPRVAMILAEISFQADNPEEVAEHVKTAAKWMPNTQRIRMLYPYLRKHRQWGAISDSDIKQPYEKLVPAMSAVEAYMNINDISNVSIMTLQAVKKWPYDIRVLEPLFFLSIKHTNPKWETLFSRQLVRSVNRCQDQDVIYPLFERCFQLQRPDMAWFLYWRIEKIDSQSPILPFVVAKYGSAWFRFRKQNLKFPTSNIHDEINIIPFIQVGALFNYYHPWLKEIPFVNELSNTNVIAFRKEQMDEAVTRFAEYKKENKLSLAMHYVYVDALEISGSFERATEELAGIAEKYPEQKDSTKFRLSKIYEDRGDWQNVYETLRPYRNKSDVPLKILLRLCQAERNLKLSLMALQTAAYTVKLYPDSTKAAEMQANTLLEFSTAAKALFALNRPRKWHNRDIDILTAEVMQKTQRFKKARQICENIMYPSLPLPIGTIQYFFASPAEFSILWHHIFLPSPEDFTQSAKVIRANIKTVTSPFLKAMMSNWLGFYDGNTNAANIAVWADCGRDNAEKATALKQYALLLANKREFSKALDATVAAAELLPQSPLLWHMAISFSNADTNIIAQARKACPDDGDIWLAQLITMTRPAVGDSSNSSRKNTMVQKTIINQLTAFKRNSRLPFPVETFTRAAEYLFRIGMPEPASIAAAIASDNAQSYLPAHIIAIKCALHNKDTKWALRVTKRAIDSALNPPSLLFKELVKLKVHGKKLPTDSEMVEALSNLRRNEQNNLVWAEMLGYIRFKRGNWEVMDALQEMTFAIRNGSKNKLAFVIAAESSRILNNFEQAIYILREGLKLYPDDMTLLNNLAFVLAQSGDNIGEAVEIIEKLIEKYPDNLQIRDTAVAIYIKNNNMAEAEKNIKFILNSKNIPPDILFRTKTNEASILITKKQFQQAKEILQKIISDAENIDKYDIAKAVELLNNVKTTIYKEKNKSKRVQ